MSEPEEPRLEELERQLDAAFATTRPRRGFEDELWSRLEARRLRRRLGWPRDFPWAMAGSLAVLLVIGLVAVTLARSAGGRGGGAAMSQPATARSSTVAGAAATTPGPLAQSALPFGRLPAPAKAGQVQVVSDGALSPLPAGSVRLVPAAIAPPESGPTLPVYRYDPASGPAAGSVLEPGSLPPGLETASYPAQPPGNAISEAAARAAASNPATQQGEVTLTQARLVYVAVVADGRGYLEPAYLYTGTEQAGGTTVPAQILLTALSISVLR